MKKRYIGFILAAMMTAQPLAAQGAVIKPEYKAGGDTVKRSG